ncbi:TIGR01777 family oxidoreductase [Glutamicibacter sp.]|uniref:TIGR01777 family oxidoreductase n=1 Tax=Glutamicibacter sp. TaxID=1931995 RepID=UPI003D6C0445
MTLKRSSQLPATPPEVLAWFSRPGAIRRLLPPWLPVHVIQEAGSLRDGVAILGLPGGIRWHAEHQATGCIENEKFVDQLKPRGLRGAITSALQWKHEHFFEATGSGTTIVGDHVTSNLPARQVERMLAYRHRQLAADFAAHQRASDAGLRPQRIAITGTSGLVGEALCAFLATGGHQVIKLVRRSPKSTSERSWDPAAPAEDLLEGVDAVIHLAGASIFGRFGEAHRKAIEASRVGPTRALARLAERTGVAVFISASGTGYYGSDTGPGPVSEDNLAPAAGSDFLADVVRRWEQAAQEGGTSMRRVQIRTGVVLSPRGGMLAVLRPVFAAGLGGRLGTGAQYLSWIGLDDLLDIYHRALWDSRLSGPLNAVAPNPVTNAEFTRALGKVLRRPAVIPVPAAAPMVALGADGTRMLAMASQNVIPRKLQDAGHAFRRGRIELELAHNLGARLRR